MTGWAEVVVTEPCAGTLAADGVGRPDNGPGSAADAAGAAGRGEAVVAGAAVEVSGTGGRGRTERVEAGPPPSKHRVFVST